MLLLWRREGAEVFLEDLGWNSYFHAMWANRSCDNCFAARVVSQQRGLWRIAGEFPECWAEPSGRLRASADAGGDWPTVGDWIAADRVARDPSNGERATMHWVLPRRGCLARKAPGKQIERQVIAANIDTAFLVGALTGDFSPRRLERYLALCWESGVKPVIVLNKADECGDVPARVAEAQSIAAGVPVFALSARNGKGIDALGCFLAPGQTIVLLGSSGVGKSTLLNHLVEQEVQAVQRTRESDGKGRHTTTSRQLFRLRCGALVVDTPGLRELALWDADRGIETAFADIENIALQCRFRDCRHESEPGCAVRAALAEGALDQARLENRKKLEREQAFQRRKTDPEAMHEYKQRIGRLMRGVREKYRQRDREGGKP
jgi:ribosome biogenesis GTPase / thiamine phosphate phosphatase